MEIYNDPIYSDFISKVKEQLKSENYDELFKNCRGFFKKYDNVTFDYFQTIEERYLSKSESTTDIIDDLLNLLNNITAVDNSNTYKIDTPRNLSIVLFLAILCYMFSKTDLSITPNIKTPLQVKIKTQTEVKHYPVFLEYLPIRINSADLTINEVLDINMNTDIDYIKSLIIKKNGYKDTVKINKAHQRNIIFIDENYKVYFPKTSIKDFYYTGKIKHMSTISVMNIDSVYKFGYPPIPNNQIVNHMQIHIEPFPMNQENSWFEHINSHYVTAPENREKIKQEINAIFEKYEYLIERETDSNVEYFLII